MTVLEIPSWLFFVSVLWTVETLSLIGNSNSYITYTQVNLFLFYTPFIYCLFNNMCTFLSLGIFGLLTSSLLLLSKRFGWCVLQLSSGISCWTWEPTQNLELNPLFNPQAVPILLTMNRRCPWCSRYRRRKWTRRHEFKSWTRLIAFHIALAKGINSIILPPAMGK